MPFQIGEKVCILTGQRAGELANVMGFSDRTEMVELVLEKSKSKYFRPVSALSTFRFIPSQEKIALDTHTQLLEHRY